MSNKSKLIIISTFVITLILAIAGFYYLHFIVPDSQTPIEQEKESCPPKGECEFYDCEKQKIYKDNCEFEISDGFCCNGYNSPTDRCRKKDFCAGLDDNLCENAGEEFSTCDRCSVGKSSLVKVLQGEKGCEYEYQICKPDPNCGEIPEDDDSDLTNDSKQCADDRKIGEEWKECCIGEDIGKSRTIRKNEDCSLIIISPCTTDDECKDHKDSGTIVRDPNTPGITQQPSQIQDQETTPSQDNQEETSNNTPVPQRENANTQENNDTDPESVPEQTRDISSNDTPTTVPQRDPITENAVESDTTSTPIPQNTRQSEASIATIIPEEPARNTYVEPGENTLQPTPTDIENIQEDMEVLPRTSLQNNQIVIILSALGFIILGIYITHDTQIRIRIEEKVITLYYLLFPNTRNKKQEARTKKIFEKKLELKSAK